MKLVVSDTSPIRALNHLNLLDFLGVIFSQVLVPPAVLAELENPRASFEPVDIRRFNFIEIAPAENEELIQSFLGELQRGESEAIALAVERQAVLLIDEAAGRAVASRVGLHRIGVLGVLVEARKQNRITE